MDAENGIWAKLFLAWAILRTKVSTNQRHAIVKFLEKYGTFLLPLVVLKPAHRYLAILAHLAFFLGQIKSSALANNFPLSLPFRRLPPRLKFKIWLCKLTVSPVQMLLKLNIQLTQEFWKCQVLSTERSAANYPLFPFHWRKIVMHFTNENASFSFQLN